ncbi:MAG TPA: formyltransferase family protein [Saliniramus sp.]|nr:formyltransferase family protein [Saliniramus sp.]
MRFAFAGIDMFGSVFETLLAGGWQPVKLFTRPCDGVLDFNDRVLALARHYRLPIQLSRITRDDIALLANQGCECLVVAGYPWLVKGWEGLVPYAFNVHPSPLPEGRGPYPLMRAILEGRRNWGVSAHVLAPTFDTGAIIAQETFPLSDLETHDSLLARCQMGAGRIAGAILRDLPGLWAGAAPQGVGSYWNRSTDADRVLDWSRGVDHVLRTVRAFGSIETIARLSGSEVFVSAATGWHEAHDLPAGSLVHRYQRHITIAASDGFVILTRWSSVSQSQAREIGR